jgi:hypothetical protein
VSDVFWDAGFVVPWIVEPRGSGVLIRRIGASVGNARALYCYVTLMRPVRPQAFRLRWPDR